MEIDDKVQAVINKVQSGELTPLLSQLDGSDFGIHVPVFEDDGTIRMMLEGYSQVERDLVVSIAPDGTDEGALPIGWFGRIDGKDSSCKHGGTDSCRHCTGHSGACRHCTHPRDNSSSTLDAPGLDYFGAVQDLENKRDLLASLAPEGLGLLLVHGHSSEHMFTKLPSNYVSVVVNGKTEFRLDSEVAADSTFVPSAWRVVNGALKVAGGHSQRVLAG